MTPEIVTIGVYGFEKEGFFGALAEAGVTTFCDLRWRRGLRGARYAFANSRRLQARLAEMGIDYIHRRDLAPTPAVRERQKAADRETKTAKRQRETLDEAFIAAYEEAVLDEFDAGEFLAALGAEADVVALFCVERAPAACHRALVAERLAGAGAGVRHLMPED